MHRFSPSLFGTVFSEITNEEANSKGNIEKYVQLVLAHIPLLLTSHGEPKNLEFVTLGTAFIVGFEQKIKHTLNIFVIRHINVVTWLHLSSAVVL